MTTMAFWYAPIRSLLRPEMVTSAPTRPQLSTADFLEGAAQQLLNQSAQVGHVLAFLDRLKVVFVARIVALDAKNSEIRCVRLPHSAVPELDETYAGVTKVPAHEAASFQFPIEALLIAPPPTLTELPASAPSTPAEVEPLPNELESPLKFGAEGKPRNLLLYGPPGTGKTFSLKRRALGLVASNIPPGDAAEDRKTLDTLWRQACEGQTVAMCTFHQAYSYEEFVEGIRPATEGGQVSYRVEDGLFKRTALLALADALPAVPRNADASERIKAAKDALARNALPTRYAFDAARPYVLVIDEINRANISRVMGELITLLEGEKRIGGDDPLVVTLPTSKERFAVPPNLHIIGTLNTADRSIALMDVALRRRFVFEEMRPDVEVIKRHLAASDDVKRLAVALFEKINERLLFLYDREHQIGHAYFLKATSISGLRDVMVKKVLPLLQEYFFGQWNRVALTLGHPMKPGGHDPVELDPKTAAILTVRAVNEIKTIGFNHDDYADTFEYGVHPDFAKTNDEVWLAKALWSLLAPLSDKAEREKKIAELVAPQVERTP